MISSMFRAGALLSALALAGCNASNLEDVAPKSPRADYAVSSKLATLARSRGMEKTSPILVRIFKEENALEIWKQKTDGRYGLITTYQMCRWSGKLGPKFTEGDRQAPEGFYNVTPGHLNPNSKFYLAFNMGYPNAFDRANGRTGAHLMVHGACSSSGCYSMTDGQMQEIYALARDAFAGGQRSFQIQAFPFRMTAANMARYRDDPNIEFWTMLKEGYDRFEIARVPPQVGVCGKKYVFGGGGVAPDGKETNVCAPQSTPQVADAAYKSYQDSYASSYSEASKKSDMPAARASIQGAKEAALVADWSKKRSRGERVTMQPPSMRTDGTVVATGAMGRIDSDVGRRMAAKDAKEAEEKRIAAEKKAAEERAKAELAAKQEAVKLAELEAARAKAEAAEQKKLAKAEAAAQQKTAKAQKAAEPAGTAAKGDKPVAAEAKPADADEAVAEARPAESKGVMGAARASAKKLLNMFGG
jgi:murein L,D-transpeptidase YafK